MLLFVCLFFAVQTSTAQKDLIVTQFGEEIRCNILDETPTRFVYAYVGPKGKILRNEIFKNLVKDFKYNVYQDDLPEAKTKRKKKKKVAATTSALALASSTASKGTKQSTSDTASQQRDEEVLSDSNSSKDSTKENAPISANSTAINEYNDYLKWRIGVKAGIGNILNNSFDPSNAFGLYQEKLLKGWTFGADIGFFPMEGFGLGVVYTDFQSSNSDENLTYINPITGVEETGSISNKISRKFIGPAVFLRKGIDFKTFIVLGLSPGMYFYSDKGAMNGANFDFKGNNFGGAVTLGLDFFLGNDITGRDIILSLEAGYNYGRLTSIDYGDGNGELLLDTPLIMDRLDFSIGLRFMRFPGYLKK